MRPEFQAVLRIQAWDDHKPRNAAPTWKPRWARPTAMNALSKLHWGTERRLSKMWEAAAVAAIEDEGIAWMRFEALRFDFLPVYTRQPTDTAATAITEKWIVDGFTRLGLIADDNRFHNAGQLSLPPIISNWTGITTRIIARPAAADHPPRLECGCRESMELMQRVNDHRSNRKRAK